MERWKRKEDRETWLDRSTEPDRKVFVLGFSILTGCMGSTLLAYKVYVAAAWIGEERV